LFEHNTIKQIDVSTQGALRSFAAMVRKVRIPTRERRNEETDKREFTQVNKSSNNGFYFFVNGDLVISVNKDTLPSSLIHQK
jgi:hypothetical protein